MQFHQIYYINKHNKVRLKHLVGMLLFIIIMLLCDEWYTEVLIGFSNARDLDY